MRCKTPLFGYRYVISHASFGTLWYIFTHQFISFGWAPITSWVIMILKLISGGEWVDNDIELSPRRAMQIARGLEMMERLWTTDKGSKSCAGVY